MTRHKDYRPKASPSEGQSRESTQERLAKQDGEHSLSRGRSQNVSTTTRHEGDHLDARGGALLLCITKWREFDLSSLLVFAAAAAAWLKAVLWEGVPTPQ